MSQRSYCLVSGVLWLVFAAAHGLRIAMRWSVFINGRHVPLRASAVAVVVGAYLAASAFRLLKKPTISAG